MNKLALKWAFKVTIWQNGIKNFSFSSQGQSTVHNNIQSINEKGQTIFNRKEMAT